MPCEDCVSRRAFLATTFGATALATLSGCGDGFVANPVALAALPNGPTIIIVANFPGLATVGVLVRVPQTAVAVKRVDATTFLALSMICTHQRCTTSITNGQRFDCPCHSSRFDGDGAVINGPATEALGRLTATYNAATDELTIS